MRGPGTVDGDGIVIALEPATARALLRALSAAVGSAGDGPRGDPLTPRETEVMLRLAEGKGYGQIAAELVIELETVRTHARRVRRKLGVATSRELRGRRLPSPSAPASDPGHRPGDDGAEQITP